MLLRRFDRPDGSLMHAEVGMDGGAVMIGGGTAEFHAQGRIRLFCTPAAVGQRRDVRRAPEFGRNRDMADIDQAAPIRLD
jgi:hypothetical protein